MTAKMRKCLSDKLATKVGFGKETLKRAMAQFDRDVARFKNEGLTDIDATARASAQVMQTIDVNRSARTKALRANTETTLAIKTAIDNAKNIKGGTTGNKIGRALLSLISADPDVPGAHNWQAQRDYNLNRYNYLRREDLDRYSKGAFRHQRGKGDIDDIINEVHNPGSTRNQPAQRNANGWRKILQTYVDDMNLSGIALRTGSVDRLPFAPSSAKLYKIGPDQFVDDLMPQVNWNKTTTADGATIPAADREEFLRKLFDAYRTGDFKPFDEPFMATGGVYAQDLRNDFMLTFNDGMAWKAMHTKYGDGTVFDVMTRYIEKAANNIAKVKIFGTNTEAGIRTARRMATEAARNATWGPKAERASDELTTQLRRFDDTTDVALHLNPMDPMNKWGLVHGSMHNITTAALLGSAVTQAIFGDPISTMATRVAQGYGRGIFRVVGGYLGRFLVPGRVRGGLLELADAGFVMNELTAMNYMTARYGVGAQYGASATKNWADSILRASMLNRHTNALISVVQLDILRTLARHAEAGRTLEQIPERMSLQMAGITEAEWTKIKTNMTTRDRNGKLVFQPLADEAKNGYDLTAKIYRMMDEQSRLSVVQTGPEARVRMLGSNRTTGFAGVLQAETMAYGGFMTQNFINVTRLFKSMPTAMSKTKLVAALMFGGLITGFATTQIRQLLTGKEMYGPEDYTDPEFVAKVLVNGLSLGILGEFVAGMINSDNRTLTENMAGPVLSGAETIVRGTLRAGWGAFSDEIDGSKEWAGVVRGVRQFVTPKTWWSAMVVQRDFFDVLDEAIDPVGARRRQNMSRTRAREHGTPYYAPPGQSITGVGELLRGR